MLEYHKSALIYYLSVVIRIDFHQQAGNCLDVWLSAGNISDPKRVKFLSVSFSLIQALPRLFQPLLHPVTLPVAHHASATTPGRHVPVTNRYSLQHQLSALVLVECEWVGC